MSGSLTSLFLSMSPWIDDKTSFKSQVPHFNGVRRTSFYKHAWLCNMPALGVQMNSFSMLCNGERNSHIHTIQPSGTSVGIRE